MTKTNNLTDHALMTPGRIILILENLANELALDAKNVGRSGDHRPQALREAARKLRETGCTPDGSKGTRQASEIPLEKMLNRAVELA